MAASQFNVSNLITLVDRNSLMIDGRTEEVPIGGGASA